VVTVTGPRQSGKTTLVKNTFPDLPYVNLEAPDVRDFAIRDPRAFLSQYPKGAILDEVQRAPDLFSYIQTLVDEHDRKGEFILTGSHQLLLHQGLAQSLAGRVAILLLLPMSLSELKDAGFNESLDEWMFKGGYPRIYKDQLNPTVAYRNYHQTYLERDVRDLIHIKDLSQFQKFIRLCAGRVGQILNVSSLANDVGLSSHTIKHWLSVLEASYLIVLLHPYFENFGKRVIKSPKLYFTDIGFVCYLLGIENTQQLSRDPLRGNLFENLMMLELYKARANLGLDPKLYYYRDQRGLEIDFIWENGRKLVPIEVKAAETYISDFGKGIQSFQEIAGERSDQGYIIYAGEREFSTGALKVCNYQSASQIVLAKGLSNNKF
jgi:hypothetical protein